jgi:serine phosphatase RsbU (regulator of sigma subunit)/tetratricopeptide (TPR) repeat protein
MNKPYYIFIVLLLTFILGCGQRKANNAGNTAERKTFVNSSQKDGTDWAKEAQKQYKNLAYYYNNNIHDTLVMKVPEVLDFCREHKLWADYYDTWMLLGQDYSFNGEYHKAIKVAQEIHDDATQRGNKYGLTAAEFIKGLMYDGQANHKEAARSFEIALDNYPADAPPFQKNNIYVYYLAQLKDLDDTKKMRQTLDEWKAYIDDRRQDTTIADVQFNNWLYYYHHSCYTYYMHLKDLDKAAMHVDSVVMHLDKTGWSMVTRNEVIGYRTLLAIERKNYAEALKLNDIQLPLAKELDINAYADILAKRATILSKLERWKEAYSYLDQHYELVDSLKEEESTRQLNELNKRFELDELRAQQEREKMESERQQMYLLMAIVAIIFIAIVVFILLRLQAARRLAILKTEQERIESELRIARNIQMSMVPSTFPNREGLDMYASMTPAREVGGDLYGYVINGDSLYFCLGDVSGKGVPASLFMAQATRLFQTLAKQGLPPAEICTRMNDALSGEDNGNMMFVTFFLGLIDLNTGHLSFCNAGHNPPIIGGSPTHGDFLKMAANVPLGLWAGFEFVGEEIDCIKGRPLFIYTDGLNEAEDTQQQQFGDERLLSILRNTHFESSQQVVEHLAEEVEKHRNGAEPNDDLTMMCIRVEE